MKTIIICQICNKKFKDYFAHKRKFCSRNCYYKFMETRKGKLHPKWKPKVKLNCRICGKIFEVNEARKNIAKICSRKCYAKWRSLNYKGLNHYNWKGGKIHSYTWARDWRLLRDKILQRDNYKCKKCGNKNQLEIHHIVPYEIIKNHSEKNLITLCKSCHTKEERKWNSKGKFIKIK